MLPPNSLKRPLYRVARLFSNVRVKSNTGMRARSEENHSPEGWSITLRIEHASPTSTARPYVDHRVCRLAGIASRNPSVALSLVVPRRGHRARILRPCLLAPSITGAYLEPRSRP